MELEEGQLQVYYNCGWTINEGLDEALRKLLTDYGYKCWATGCDLTNGVRDLAFRLITEEEEIH